MKQHCANAQAIAEYLSANPKVAWVKYCGLEGDASKLTEPIWMIPDDIHGLFPVFPVQLHCPVGADTVRCQKSDHIPGTTVS